MLDIAGLSPGIGNVPDLLNAVIYVAEGDLANAALSGASAIPLVGIFSTTTKIVKTNVKSKKVVKGVGGSKSSYSHLEDPPNVAVGKDFTQLQKNTIMQENIKSNGAPKSDFSATELVKPQKSQKGVTPPQNEWQIDHIVPKDKGGTNSYNNAQVLSRQENREKWNN